MMSLYKFPIIKEKNNVVKFLFYSPGIISAVFILIVASKEPNLCSAYTILAIFFFVLTIVLKFFQNILYEKVGTIELSKSFVDIKCSNNEKRRYKFDEVSKIKIYYNSHSKWVTQFAFYRTNGLGNKIELCTNEMCHSFDFVLENPNAYYLLKKIILELVVKRPDIVDYYEKGKKIY